MNRPVLALAASLLLLVPAASHAAKPVKDPVAVLPFKNLGGDPGLDWLGKGIAETMISDLRRSKKVTLVERDQVNVALYELLERRPAGGNEEADAATVGKMVGAKTVVVGGYQQAGKKLRINARFVEVETGVILDSVKATGSMNDVFGVQDQVVAKLIGAPPKRPVAKKPAAKTAPKQIEAYRLYAMSLVTLSDAQRQGYLQQALEVDPGFVYAAEALDRLEERLAAYSKRAVKALDERHRAMRAKIDDPAAPESERAQLAVQLMNELVQRRMFRMAAAEAKRIYDMKFTPSVNMDPHEWASHNLVVAHKQLKRDDLALQYAERHLQEFPAGPTYPTVDFLAKEIVSRRKQVPLELAEREAEIARVENELAEREKRDRGPPLTPEVRARIESGPCIFGSYTHIPREVESDCRAYLDKWMGDSSVPPAVLLGARYRHALALYELGRFDEAKEVIAAIQRDAPQFAAEMNMGLATGFWIAE